MITDKEIRKRTQESISGLINKMRRSDRLIREVCADRADHLLREGQEGRDKAAQSLGEFFGNLDPNPCYTCVDTCCTSYTAAGHFNYTGSDLHSDVIEGKVDLMDYYVPFDPEDFHVFSQLRDGKCGFLKAGHGCNLPQKYKSETCLMHSCHKMQKVIAHEDKDEHFVSLTEMLRKSGKEGEKISRIRTFSLRAAEAESNLSNLKKKLSEAVGELETS